MQKLWLGLFFTLISGCIPQAGSVNSLFTKLAQLGSGAPLSASVSNDNTTGLPLPMPGPVAQAEALIYSGPIVITHGGTYSGNWTSTDLTHPVIFINTTEPVIIENCNIKSAGPTMISTIDSTISNWRVNTDLIVRNCNAYGVLPTEDQVQYPVFIDAYQSKRLWVENNFMEHTRSTYLNEFHGDGSLNQSIRFTHNVGKNIDGRYRDGTHDSSGTMFQLNGVKNTPNIEVAWNQIINEPGKSAVGDNLNFYATTGTAASPILVHDNYIQGAYAADPTAFDFNGTGMTTDGPVCNSSMSDAQCLSGLTQYMKIYNNTVVSTCNAGINNVVGINIKILNNRVITSGALPDGRNLTRLWSGIGYGVFYSNVPDRLMVGNEITGNLSGYVTTYMDGPYRQRQDIEGWCIANHPEICHDNQAYPNPLTLANEANEWDLWNAKLRNQSVVIGSPQNGSNGLVTSGGAGNFAWGNAH